MCQEEGGRRGAERQRRDTSVAASTGPCGCPAVCHQAATATEGSTEVGWQRTQRLELPQIWVAATLPSSSTKPQLHLPFLPPPHHHSEKQSLRAAAAGISHSRSLLAFATRWQIGDVTETIPDYPRAAGTAAAAWLCAGAVERARTGR